MQKKHTHDSHTHATAKIRLLHTGLGFAECKGVQQRPMMSWRATDSSKHYGNTDDQEAFNEWYILWHGLGDQQPSSLPSREQHPLPETIHQYSTVKL